jgi:hypothetical protein
VSSTAVTPAFNTADAGETLLAFVASDGPEEGWQSMDVSGGGLEWRRLARANTQAGVAEIWKAIAPTALRGATVTSTARKAGYHQSLTVIAYAGKTATGAVAIGGARYGTPSLSLTTTQPNSYVVGVGDDWDNALSRTPDSGQVLLHQWVDTTTFDTYWVQATAAAPDAGSLVTVNDQWTSDRWNLAAVEVYPAAVEEVHAAG